MSINELFVTDHKNYHNGEEIPTRIWYTQDGRIGVDPITDYSIMYKIMYSIIERTYPEAGRTEIRYRTEIWSRANIIINRLEETEKYFDLEEAKRNEIRH